MKDRGLFYGLVKFHTDCMIGLEIVGVSVQPNIASKKQKYENPTI